MGLSLFFPIRNKFFISFALLALVAVVTSFAIIYSLAKDNLQNRISLELQTSTGLITNLVDSLARASIENHLHGITETQLNMVAGFYDQYQAGFYSELEAKQLASSFLLKQKIGSTGYIYCLNSAGTVTVHHDAELLGRDVSDFDFVQDQLRLKTGYLEYRWRNSGDSDAREKVLYMGYFPAWDWIISVSAYKSEFYYLVDFEQIRKALDKVRFGKSGYPFIFNGQGDLLYHPLSHGNFYTAGFEQEFIEVIEEIFQEKKGSLNYSWKNPGESQPRDKIAIFSYLNEFDWYVGTSAYLDELYQPLKRIKKSFLVILIVCVIINSLAGYWLSRVITRPLNALVSHFKHRDVAKVALIRDDLPGDEIGMLGNYLNQFIVRLNDYHSQLASQIKEREQSEKALRDSEQTFDSLFNNSFQFIALLDGDGRVMKVNQTALKFRNLQLADVAGMVFWETPWWNHSETLVTQLKEAMTKVRQGQVARFEAYSNAVREVYLDISLKPITDNLGDILFIIAEARDVTDIRRAEYELQQAQKMESVGTLAGGIAHDFNNALAGILGVISLLQIRRENGTSIPEDDIFQHLEMISSSALRAKDIVNQLLTLSRKYDFEIVPVNLAPVLEQVTQIATNSFDKSIRISSDIDSDILVVADANSLEQVFLNLFINAAHAMTIMRDKDCPWGGTLALSARQLCMLNHPFHILDAYWCISVRDTGVGIAKADLEKIFEPFFTTKGKGVGSGMGMAMVYHIVKQHNGFIEVDSEPGEGTVVRVYLPVSHQQEAAPAESGAEKIVRGRGTILVVDDEELVRLSTEALLLECGYHVVLAENGAEAIAVYRDNPCGIDLVLLDLVMPVLAGKETYEQLKIINPEVKVLLSSGFKQDSRVADILGKGALGFIQKPYSLVSLSREISRILLT